MPKTIPIFVKHLGMMHDIHIKKNTDYADSKWNENFERSAIILSWFHNPQDGAYVSLIATKLARLANLLNKAFEGKDGPENESIADSFLDLNTYCNLMWCDYESRTVNQTPNRTEEASDRVGRGAYNTLSESERQTDKRAGDSAREIQGGELKAGAISPINRIVHEFAKYIQHEKITVDEAAYLRNVLNNTDRRGPRL